MRTVTIRFDRVGYFFIALVMLLNSGYYRTTLTDSYVPMLLMIGITGMAFLFVRRKRVGAIVWPLILAVGIFFSILFNFNSANLLSGGRVFVTMMCGYFLVNWLDRHLLFEIFSKLMRIIILISLFFAVVLAFAPGLGLPTFQGYYDLFFFTGRPGARGHGIFWEPGVFASMVLMTMLVHIYFYDKKIKWTELLIYVIGVFLSQSTAGIMLLFLLTFGYVWRETGLVKSQAASVSFVLVALIAVLGYESLFAFLNDIAPQIFHKLVETESQTTMTRTMGPIINLRIFAQKPLFGWGFTGAAAEYSKHLSYHILAQTSTSTQILSSMGICGIVYTLAFVYPLFAKKSAKVLYFVDKSILAICMIAIVNKEPHVFFLTTWMLMFYFFEFCRKRPSAHSAEREITDFDEKRSC